MISFYISLLYRNTKMLAVRQLYFQLFTVSNNITLSAAICRNPATQLDNDRIIDAFDALLFLEEGNCTVGCQTENLVLFIFMKMITSFTKSRAIWPRLMTQCENKRISFGQLTYLTKDIKPLRVFQPVQHGDCQRENEETLSVTWCNSLSDFALQ